MKPVFPTLIVGRDEIRQLKLPFCLNEISSIVTLASTICSLIGELTITSINGDYIREVMVTSKNATICSLILVTLILVTSH